MSDCTMIEKWWKVSKEEEYKKYNKVLKESDVQIIQEWIRKEKHLPLLNDNQVIMFLRACEYSLERTKETIDLNYTTRTKLPEFFSQRDIERNTIITAMDFLQVAVLPERINDNIVVVGTIKEIDLSKLYVDEYIKLALMIHDMTHLEYGSSDGYIYIVDLKHLTFSLVLRLPLPTLVNVIKFWQYCATYRIKAIHIVNGGHVFEKAFPIFQPFLKPEIVAMIKLHPNYESLREAIDPRSLPSDYGGKSLSIEELSRKAQKDTKLVNEWFREEEKQRVDEKKRLSKSGNDFGIQGSFRKIDID